MEKIANSAEEKNPDKTINTARITKFNSNETIKITPNQRKNKSFVIKKPSSLTSF